MSAPAAFTSSTESFAWDQLLSESPTTLQLPSRYRSPFVDLGEDLFRKILSYICAESLDDVITTDAYRFLLPFAVCSKHHYIYTLHAIRGLSLLPLNFSAAHNKQRKIPAFPLPSSAPKTNIPSVAITTATPVSITTPASKLPLSPSSSFDTKSDFSQPTFTVFPNLRPTQALSFAPFSKPTSLTSMHRTTLMDTRLARIASSLPSLRIVRLFNNSEISDIGLHLLTSAAPNLEELRLRAVRTVTVRGLEALASCPRITTLDLSFSRNLGDECAQLIASLPRLRHLYVAYWRITDAFMATVLQNTSLRRLCVSSCSALTAHSFKLLAYHARIESLSVRSNDALGDDALRWIASCSSLTTVDVSLARRLTDDGLRHFAMTDVHSTDHSALVSLSLSNIPFLTDQSLRNIATGCKALRHLDLSCCNMITDNGIEALRNLTHLKSLDVSGCTSLTDQAIDVIASLPQLTDLKLARCFLLTDTAVDSIVDHASQNNSLMSIDMRYCNSVSTNALNRLQLVCAQLLRPRH